MKIESIGDTTQMVYDREIIKVGITTRWAYRQWFVAPWIGFLAGDSHLSLRINHRQDNDQMITYSLAAASAQWKKLLNKTYKKISKTLTTIQSLDVR